MSTSNENATIRIDLTPEQSERIKAETGRAATTIELTVQELEARIAPMSPGGYTGDLGRLASNHNETFLID
jgi:hypothetical protein